MSDVAPYTCLSVCSGVGFLDHAVNTAIGGTLEPVLYVEREAFSAANLAWQMEKGFLAEAPIWSDLKQLPSDYLRQIERLDFFIGGIPCQPYSAAGKQLGADDDRDLWPASAEAISQYEPEFVFIENVAGFASKTRNDGLHRVRTELEAMGYRVAAGLFSSVECGANHQRLRSFLLAVSRRGSVPLKAALDGRTGRQQTEGNVGGSSEELADAGRQRGGCSEREQYFLSQPEIGDSGMANAEREPEWPGLCETGPGGNGRERLCDLGGSVADSDQSHTQRRGKKNLSEGRQISDGHAGLECRELPHYAPPRNDYRAWAIVAGLDPSRMPSIKSEVRGMANGVASRADQLRVVGNGVDWLVAAYAFVSLWAALEYGV